MHDVEIIDTAGQEEFMSFRDSSMAHGDAFLALCAINSYPSWIELKTLREKVISEQDGDTNVPMVIVANKRVSYHIATYCLVTNDFKSGHLLGFGGFKTSTSGRHCCILQTN